MMMIQTIPALCAPSQVGGVVSRYVLPMLLVLAQSANAQSVSAWAVTQTRTISGFDLTIPSHCPINSGAWVGLERVASYNCTIVDGEFTTAGSASATFDGTLRASASQSLSSTALGPYSQWSTTARADWFTGPIAFDPAVTTVDFVFRYTGSHYFNATTPVFPIIDDAASSMFTLKATGLIPSYGDWSGAVVTRGQIQNSSNVSYGNAAFSGSYKRTAQRVDVDGWVHFREVPVLNGMLGNAQIMLSTLAGITNNAAVTEPRVSGFTSADFSHTAQLAYLLAYDVNGRDVSREVTATLWNGQLLRVGSPTVVPEPGRLILIATGLLALALVSRSRGKRYGETGR